MGIRALLCVSLIALAAPAVAAGQNQDQPSAEAAPEKKVCRRGSANTGSIMAARPVCRTKTEWARIDEANRRATDEMRDRGRKSPVDRSF